MKEADELTAIITASGKTAKENKKSERKKDSSLMQSEIRNPKSARWTYSE